ncbi:MAG: helicase-related protein, partial [Myxococcota bacterium]
MGPGHVIDMRKQLLLDPPDVLLTNYKMLDFLLLRPKDRALWAKNGPDTLRYVVIDELHTYDGAQGTDVACLLRRLSARLGMRRPFCPVGTSATVTSGGADSEARLLRFAGDVFAREPDELAIVGERRRTPASFFGLFGGVRRDGWPEDAEALLARPDDTLESHVARVARAWFPDVRRLSEGEGVDRAALADAVMGHPAMRALIEVASEGIVDLEALDANLGAKMPSYAGRDEEDRRRLLVSMLTLLSWSEHEAGGRRTPLVNVQVQLWIREIRRLLRELSAEPRFHWDDERPRRRGEPAALPMYLCRACGHSGWVSLRNDVDDRLETDRRRIGEQAVRRSPDMLYLHTDGHAAAEELPGVEDRVCPRCARLGREAKCRFCKGETVGVYTHQARSSQTPPKDVQRCPACGTDFALGIMGSRAATLASVAVGHLYTSPFNRDQRLLAFSDSVQDASHRAGFFSGRTQRFSLRKGMLAVVPHEGAMPLPEVAPAMIAYYAPRPPPGSMVAGFMPHDLEYREAYERYMGALEEHARAADRARRDGAPEPEPPAPDATVLRDLGERLRWEVTRELGLGTRIGRTLERTGCASVAVDPDRFGEALAAVRRRVPERVGAVQGVPEARWAQFLGGLVARLRMRGGIHDPLLAPYFERGGSDYQLSKAMSPLLSPFGLFTSRPLFLTDDPEPKRFDTVRPGKRGNWYTDWARRALGVGLSAGDAADVYGAVLPLLEKARLMVGAHDRKKSAWGLDPHALAVSRDVRVLRCPECGHEHWGVARDPAALEGGPCLRYRCTGELAAVVMDGGDARVRTYYQKLYDQPELGRVRASEHTGLLERSDREGLEERFKERRRPDAPNMLSCTPTLEMGIDIGDLSATMLLSVPPTTASYLQRIGRAGRKTGNALILTFSTVRPHDLHFFGDPEAAMAGPVEPPGCYLDAPEILKRQALAWCMDAWAREGGTHEDALPGAVQGMLSGDANRGFPASFFRFLEERRDGLREGFLASFGTSAATRRALEDFMRGAGPTASVLEQRVLRFAEEVRAEHKQLRSLAKSVRERMKKMDAEPQKVAGYEDERADLKNELSFLEKEAGAVFKKSLLGLMCERGLLPNYAFPESGVTLKAFVARDGDHHGGAERYEWVRSASTALRELAPFNTFYAQARRVRVDNLDVGARRGRKGQGQIEPWQLCSSCGHMRPVARLGPSPSCPSCGAGDFREQGRRRDLVKIDTVFAHSRQRDAVFSDESEERERQSYVAERWFDVDTRHVREALLDLGTPFGFELLGRVTIREINFGREAMAQAQTVGGREVPDVAFEVCEQCG